MHVLVTGAAGYLGSRVAARLTAAGTTVTGVVVEPDVPGVRLDLTDAAAVAELARVTPVDVILHCAAVVPGKGIDYDDPRMRANADMLRNLLAAWPAPVVFVSSMTVYGVVPDRPVREADAGSPTSLYGRGKLEAERMLAADGRPSRSVRLPGLFGRPRTGGLVWNTLASAAAGTPPALPPEPLVWAAMHVDDAAESLATLALAPVGEPEAVNVSYPETYSVDRFVGLVSELSGRRLDYGVRHPDFTYDLSRCAALGAIPKRGLRDALLSLGIL